MLNELQVADSSRAFYERSSAAIPRAPSVVSAGARLASIDLVRGLVIALMVLDHTRDFIGSNAISATDLSRTNAGLFFTRWVTHFCAPAFVFLAGVSALLMGRQLTRPALRRFLLTRGVWLVVVEFTVVQFAWNFNFGYRTGVVLQVIWAIGISMCALALLTFFSQRGILILGLALVAGHNLLDGIAPAQFGAWAPLWNILHMQGRTPFGLVLYPVLPWIGTMALGFAAGSLFELEPDRRRRLLFALGTGASLLFIVVRAINSYGDPSAWTAQARPWFTVLSFLNVSKYPPSLDYLLMTLGPILLALAACERLRGPGADVIRTIGQVPLFAYVLHLMLVHAFAGLLGALTGHGSALLTQIFVTYPRDWGFGLSAVYGSWLLVLTLLYPACRWFAAVKRTRKGRWWVSYV